MKKAKLIVFVLLIAAILILDRRFGWSEYLGNLEILSFLRELVQQNLWQAMLLYVLLTVSVVYHHAVCVGFPTASLFIGQPQVFHRDYLFI